MIVQKSYDLQNPTRLALDDTLVGVGVDLTFSCPFTADMIFMRMMGSESLE